MGKLVAFVVALLIAACQRLPASEPLEIVAAASLADVVDAVSQAFTQGHPNVEVRRQSVGSRVGCQYVRAGLTPVDVLVVADAELVRTLLMPKDAAFNAIFARDALVVAFPKDGVVAKAQAQGIPWQKALLGKRVGYANPATAPLGYRTLLALQLNDRFAPAELRTGEALRRQLRPADMRPDAAQLVAPLQAGALDAAFLYQAEATQQHFAWAVLDANINFADAHRAGVYASATVTLPGEITPLHGTPVAYSVTIPAAAPHPSHAAAYVAFLLSAQGRAAAAHVLPALLPAEAQQVEGVMPKSTL